MRLRSINFNRCTSEGEQKAIDEVDSILKAVFDPRSHADREAIAKLYLMFKPGKREENRFVRITSIAST